MSTPAMRFNWADSDSDNDECNTVAKFVDTDKAHEDESTSRALNFDDTPHRRFQEITIQAAIPYTLKSVWKHASTPTPEGSGPCRPLHVNRALEEVTTVLRQHCGRLEYSDLMAKVQWRSRFQSSFGSLFTFLKRNRTTFRYRQSVVELMDDETLVSELLKINWRADKTPKSPATATQ
eukprot:GILJ01020411.1.p1 GENE.GILJ01020411.1~~GILJ01020411.1.p1  ORF type:complete len:178 (+),score=32.77 GILJ01020411.1:32-565(+)